MGQAQARSNHVASWRSAVIRRQLISVGKELYDRGLQTTRSGNISARDGELFLITKTGTNLGRLKDTDLIAIEVRESAAIPAGASCETPVHRAIYNACQARAIVHAHPPYAIALAEHLGEGGITPIHNEALAKFKWIPVIETSARGRESGEEPSAIAGQLRSWPSVIIRGHGAFTVASSLDEALYEMLLLEEACKISCVVRSLSRDGR